MIAGICDIDRSIGRNGDARRRVELSRSRRAVPEASLLTGQGVSPSIGSDNTHTIIARVGNVDMAISVGSIPGTSDYLELFEHNVAALANALAASRR